MVILGSRNTYEVQGALAVINMLQGTMKLKKFCSSPVPALEPNSALKKKNVQFPLYNF